MQTEQHIVQTSPSGSCKAAEAWLMHLYSLDLAGKNKTLYKTSSRMITFMIEATEHCRVVRKEKTTLLSVIKEKLMVKLSFPLA